MALIINAALANKNRTKQYVWKDASFHDSSDLSVSSGKTDIAAVKNSLANLFSFRKGERILLPNFGNVIYEYISQPINNSTLATVKAGIIDMLSWEPRVVLDQLDVVPNEDENELKVAISYSVPSLSKSNLMTSVISITERGVVIS